MTVVVRETEPPVAVTVMVDVPAGVPPLGVMVWHIRDKLQITVE